MELSLTQSLFVSCFDVLLRICWCPDKRMYVHTANNAPAGAWGKVLGRLWERRAPIGWDLEIGGVMGGRMG